MLRYLIRRFAFLIVSLVVALVVIFVLLRLLPGDPANALLSANATPEQIAAARAQVGSDKPLLEQFTLWVGKMVRFDLGESYISTLPVAPEVTSRLLITLPLTLLSFALALVLSLVAGVVSAVKSHRWYGTVLSGFAQLGIAIPVFWVGIILVWIFALSLGLLPSGGFPRADWADPRDALTSLHHHRHRHERIADPLCALGDARRDGQRIPAHGAGRRSQLRVRTLAAWREERLGSRHRHSWH